LLLSTINNIVFAVWCRIGLEFICPFAFCPQILSLWLSDSLVGREENRGISYNMDSKFWILYFCKKLVCSLVCLNWWWFAFQTIMSWQDLKNLMLDSTCIETILYFRLSMSKRGLHVLRKTMVQCHWTDKIFVCAANFNEVNERSAPIVLWSMLKIKGKDAWILILIILTNTSNFCHFY
jgi:hypothetical protein